MSGTVTNIEMDDVLSSIRRLVSEESAEKPAPKSAELSQFILTPAHRVPEPETELPQAEAVDAKIGTSDEAAGAPVAELTEVLTAAAVVAKAAETQQQAESVPASPEFDAMEKAWKDELTRVAAAREKDSSYQPGARQSLENQIAELEEAVGQAEGEWEPDGSEPEAKQSPKRHIFEVLSNNGDARDTDVGDDLDEDVPVFSHSSVPRPKPYLLSDTTLSPGPKASAPEPSDVAADSGPAAVPVTEIIPEPVDIPVQSDVIADDDVFLDVEALRTMITEVVREELHGKLGETITRNVRKMMQQEIAQAITDQSRKDDP